ncbi:zinc-binding dehydrogenase [Streptomyces sp. NPDC093228]|uniref:zinc-binding dehydrogenase n=1 Tax=unclassified Streptomyces TaxID=2593676 RepID=UPI00074141DE|nr:MULTISPECIES: zinc-binding dehydrogenase [unclassified Streptomyces]KUJ53659.1 oxidoreductase [Streptomyces sp. NRRL F-5122]MDX3262254.1 zinc-binding dehydrogenase [Streptomyces sp. MI02-2A]REE61707.1 NADPH2:quinone reductase [Streptomyces sp. 3212.3]
MHAIRLHTFGPAENLTYERVEDPEAGPGQVRVAVGAAGVHLLDTALREGATGPAPGPISLPTIPGREVAGTVVSLGEGVDARWLGRRVVAHLGFAPGGYAELAVMDVERLHETPPNLDHAQAVAMIGTGRTTMGIVQFADLGPGSVVLVPAAAGGIGTLLVQHARHAGATVIGLAGGAEKVALVRENGAHLAVDYRDPEWAARLDGHRGAVTVVLDGVGGTVARTAVDLLAPGGRHIVFGWSAEGIRGGSPYLVEGVSEQVLGPVMLRRAGGPDPLRTLEQRALAEAAAGRLVPVVQRFPLAAAAAAHRALETRATVGKVVLEP